MLVKDTVIVGIESKPCPQQKKTFIAALLLLSSWIKTSFKSSTTKALLKHTAILHVIYDGLQRQN